MVFIIVLQVIERLWDYALSFVHLVFDRDIMNWIALFTVIYLYWRLFMIMLEDGRITKQVEPYTFEASVQVEIIVLHSNREKRLFSSTSCHQQVGLASHTMDKTISTTTHSRTSPTTVVMTLSRTWWISRIEKNHVNQMQWKRQVISSAVDQRLVYNSSCLSYCCRPFLWSVMLCCCLWLEKFRWSFVSMISFRHENRQRKS